MRSQLSSVIICLVCVLTVSACSSNKIVKTYDGDVLPNKDISILTASENITLLSVNEQPVNQYLLSNLDVKYGLKPGDNVVVFKYESIWGKVKRDEETGSRVDVVESEPLVALISAKAGKRYDFNFVPANNVREAKKIASNFVAQIVDEDKNLVAESISLANYQNEIANQKAQEQSLLVEKSTVQSDNNAEALNSLESLKAIWPTVSADEKKAFLVWVFQK